MLSTLHRKHLQSALTAPKSAARLRASVFTRTVSQHETGTHFGTVNEMRIND